MNLPAIRISELSKRYAVGRRQNHYKTLRDAIAHGAGTFWRAVRRRSDPVCEGSDELWALRDVSVEIGRGEMVGILGRNGAGKSTLLKVLSRITEPTLGRAEIWGRVGSLLEVGTGFHPELTGRENVFLNGSILGMKKAEITRKFDEIVEFSEIERFIDTPAKHYSSGMYTRLAFAVAAHLEPDILLVDEVLAVGDVAFQKKCLGKMHEVTEQGRTVVFVSHNMAVMRALCNRGIVLDNGAVVFDGQISPAIEQYFRSIGLLTNDRSRAGGRQDLYFGAVRINGQLQAALPQGEPAELSVELVVEKPPSGCVLFCILEDMHGRQVFHLRRDTTSLGWRQLSKGKHQLVVTLPALWLNPGLYSMHFKAPPWSESNVSRILSDRYPVDVAGDGSVSECVLNPDATWKIHAPAPVLAANP